MRSFSGTGAIGGSAAPIVGVSLRHAYALLVAAAAFFTVTAEPEALFVVFFAGSDRFSLGVAASAAAAAAVVVGVAVPVAVLAAAFLVTDVFFFFFGSVSLGGAAVAAAAGRSLRGRITAGIITCTRIIL